MSTQSAAEITGHLLSKGLSANSSWIQTFLNSQRTSQAALAALKQTAFFRLLQSDFTTTLQRTPASVLPANITDGAIQERRIVGPIALQVLDVDDISKSRWSQAEAIEAEERGETTRGREIIRAVPTEENENSSDPPVRESTGPHKLLLQDAAGTKVYGIELVPIPTVNTSMGIGTKLLLKDATVARGVILLEPNRVTVLGGKIEELHKVWKDGRKERLKTAARASAGTEGAG